jgi:hypothetical protein
MHYSINPQEIKTEIEKLVHTVTNIWNITQYRTKQPLSIFLWNWNITQITKTCPVRIYTTVRNKIRADETQKGYFSMCKLWKIWAQQKLLPSQTEMREMRRPLDEPVPPKRNIGWCSMCPLWWKSSCELQGMYGLHGPTKENIPTLPVETVPSSCTNKKYPIHSTRGSNIRLNNPTKFLRSQKCRARSIHKPTTP